MKKLDLFDDGKFVGVDESCQFESKFGDDYLESNPNTSEMVIRTKEYLPKE